MIGDPPPLLVAATYANQIRRDSVGTVVPLVNYRANEIVLFCRTSVRIGSANAPVGSERAVPQRSGRRQLKRPSRDKEKSTTR
jgi:hypothetical protein